MRTRNHSSIRTQAQGPGAWNVSLSAALLLLCPFDLVASLGMDMYLPAIPDMPGILGTTAERVQFTLSGYLVWLGVGQLLFGPLSDRRGRRPVLLAGALTYTLASLALAWTRAFWPFLLLRLAQAASGSAMLVATFATVRDVFASRPEGPRIYAVMSGVLVFVPAFGPLLGAILYAAGGLRAVFLAMAVSSAVAGLRAFRGWPETKPVGAETTRLHAFGTVLRSGEFWTYTLGYAVAMGSFFVFLSIAPELLIHHYGYSPLGFAVVFGAVAFVLIGASRFSSRIAERHGLVACFARGLGLIVFGALLLLIRETVRDSVVAFVLPMTVIVVGISMTVAVTANGALAGFSEMAGTATALYHCTSGVILVGVGTVAVVLLPHRTAWPLVAYGGLGASVVLLLLARSKRVSRR